MSVLGDKAKALSEHQFVQIFAANDVSGFDTTMPTTQDGGLVKSTDLDGTLSYIQKGWHDSHRDDLNIIGGGHSGGMQAGEFRHIRYSITQHRWKRLWGEPFGTAEQIAAGGFVGSEHGYDEDAGNTAMRRMFAGGYTMIRCIDLDLGKVIFRLPPPNTGYFPVGATGDATMEFYPDGNELLLVEGGILLGITEPVEFNSWRLIDNSHYQDINWRYATLRYNNVHRHIRIIGGFSQPDGVQECRRSVFIYKRTSDDLRNSRPGTLVRLNDYPSPLNLSLFTALHFTDPVSGKDVYFVSGIFNNATQLGANLNPIQTWTHDPIADTWANISSQISFPSELVMNAPGTDAALSGVVAIPIIAYGVTALISEKGGWLFKLTEGEEGRDTVTGKRRRNFADLRSGIAIEATEGWDDESRFKYAVDPNDAELVAAIGGPEKNHQIGNSRLLGEGNTAAYRQFSGALTIPQPDKVIFSLFGGGSGSMRQQFAPLSGAQVGYFLMNFDATLGAPYSYIARNSPHGSVLFVSFRLRLDGGFLAGSRVIREHAQPLFVCQTNAAGSTRITIRNDYPAVFNAQCIGKQICLTAEDPHSVAGIYIIQSVVDSRNAIVDRSPTPNGAAINGFTGILEGTLGEWTGSAWSAIPEGAFGSKVLISYGQAPAGRSSSMDENTLIDQVQSGFPNFYGNSGTWSPDTPNTTVPWKKDVFQRVLIRQQIGGNNTPDTRLTCWIDGVLAQDWLTQKFLHGDAGDPQGLAQLLFLIYHTRRDPMQVLPVSTAWYDDLCVSRQPPWEDPVDLLPAVAPPVIPPSPTDPPPQTPPGGYMNSQNAFNTNHLTFPCTVPTGQNGLQVGITFYDSDVASVTFNGLALVKTVQQNNGQFVAQSWHLASAPEGTHDMVITVAGTCSEINAGAIVLPNLDATNPIRATAVAMGSSADPISVQVASELTDLVVDTLCTVTALSPSEADQVKQWGFPGNVDIGGDGSLAPGKATSRIMAWAGAPILWAQTAVSFKTATPIPPPVNQPPSVDAGADQSITLPVKTVELQGTASDDGLPVGSSLSYQWTGPIGVTFSSPTSLQTQATFNQAGTFTLTLTVSDGELTTVDTLQVIVNPEVTPPVGDTQAPVVTILAYEFKGTFLNLTAKVADNAGAVTVELLIDGAIKETQIDTPLPATIFKFNPKLSKGQHSIEVRAIDAAGNVGSTSIVVTRV